MAFSPVRSFFNKVDSFDPKDFDSFIKEYPVTIFSLSYCGYCAASKSLLKSMGVKVQVVEVDEVRNE